jgi:hypothetical protein
MQKQIQMLLLVLILVLAAGLACCFLVGLDGSSRRTRCLDQLRWIGLALHNYHDTCGKFPLARWQTRPCRPKPPWLDGFGVPIPFAGRPVETV